MYTKIVWEKVNHDFLNENKHALRVHMTGVHITGERLVYGKAHKCWNPPYYKIQEVIVVSFTTFLSIQPLFFTQVKVLGLCTKSHLDLTEKYRFGVN